MEISKAPTVGDRKFVEILGDTTYELPPLLIRPTSDIRGTEKMMTMANQVVADGLSFPDGLLQEDIETRMMGLALNFVEVYLRIVKQWRWGDSVIQWISNCEENFGRSLALKHLLNTQVWPHAGKCSFVSLLADKHAVTDPEVNLQTAVGLRLHYLAVPPIKYFTGESLIFLSDEGAQTIYRKWASRTPNAVDLPPERFAFDILKMDMQ